MFILIISRGIPSPQFPQWGCFEKDQAEALAAIGHKVVVASVDGRFLLKWRKIGITHRQINNVDYLNSFLLPGAISKLFGIGCYYASKRWQLKRIYKKVLSSYGKPDIIYGQFFFNSYMALPISQQEKIPLVNIEHAARFNDEKIDKVSFNQSKEVYKHTAANIAVSRSLRAALHRHFNINCEVVYNVVGKEFIYSSVDAPDDKVKFVATGTLEHRKGFDLLIKAFAKSNLPRDKWQLTIIGSGSEQSNLQQLIVDEQLQENIILAGKKTKQEIVATYQNSHVFALPSRSETFGVVYTEAMACGLPVIATPCGGPEEFVTDSNGMLVPIDNVDELANAIQYMFNHYKEYHRETIAQLCRELFSSEVIAKQLTHIFEDAIAKSK